MGKTYKVSGMTCGGCANSVTNAIKTAADGVEVSVDLDAKTVTVEGAADEAVISKAVTDAGYEFGGVAG
jgi:copper chaperone